MFTPITLQSALDQLSKQLNKQEIKDKTIVVYRLVNSKEKSQAERLAAATKEMHTRDFIAVFER